MKKERVLVGVDNEAASEVAVDWVIERARHREVRVTVMTAFDLMISDPTTGEERLAALAQRIRAAVPGTEVETAFVDRSIVEGLLDWSRSHDLLVIGAHAHHPILSALAGSLPTRIAARAHGRTVLVPDDWKPSSGPVVVGVGDDDTADRALLFAAHEADESECDLEIVHTWQLPTVTDPAVVAAIDPVQLLAAHQEILDKAVERVRAGFPRLQTRSYLREGSAGEVLVARGEEACLVVLGTHHFGPIIAAIVGSVAHAVITAGGVPVCIVPSTTPTDVSNDSVPDIPARV